MQLTWANMTSSGRQRLRTLAEILLPLGIVCAFVGVGTGGYYIGSQYHCLPCDIYPKSNDLKSRDKLPADSVDDKYILADTDRINSSDKAKCLRQLMDVITVELVSRTSCIPEMQHVDLNVDKDPSIVVFPPCARIKRCGGCCSSSLLSCQPTATKIRNFEVSVSTLKGGIRRNVSLEEHVTCRCDCKLKEKDCNEKQKYDPDNCMCVCENTDEEDKCRQNKDMRIWNPHLCVCSCKKFEECNSDQYFDTKICRCRPKKSSF
ncbi:PREDICTED: vascular endothelial growth factor A-like [Dinoponera quadriceps]|uniref:Vascular endothelial growth factor A-like n=1 Tax=Dinoponera quadriceps TaxID=609295 RepID=A0A6P3XZJ2_DINQU|nr:PREDICTED: vascular endothelial growth factor A-like [Dinoponera quadriceps]